MHSSAKSLIREQRVEQSKARSELLPTRFFMEEIPNGNAVKKLKVWKNQGAEIFYLTSRTTQKQIGDIKNILKKYHFPDNKNLFFRKKGEQYKDVAEKLMPDILIEDDCESIGGMSEMTYPHIRKDLKSKIKSIVVKEFGGVGHLPSDLEELQNYDSK